MSKNKPPKQILILGFSCVENIFQDLTKLKLGIALKNNQLPFLFCSYEKCTNDLKQAVFLTVATKYPYDTICLDVNKHKNRCFQLKYINRPFI